MKNFFKKLSFVMALALVLTSLAPAGAAKAAKAMKMNDSNVILYLTENAKDTPDEFDFTIKNKPEDWKSTLSFKWESSNEDVAVVGKAGMTQAVGVGTATISCTVTDKETEEVVAAVSAKVTVKANADKIKINNAPESGKVGIGENVIDLNRTLYVDGVATTKRGVVCTNYTRWTSSNEEIATVDKNGVVTVLKAGEFTITAEAYQSKKNDETIVSDSVKLVAEAGLVGVAQKSPVTAEVTFDTDMSKVVTKDNLIVSKVVGTTPVKQIVKSIKFDTTGKVATVEMYVDFAANAEYTFEYGEYKAGFVGAKLTVDEVAQIVLATTSATVNDPTEVKVKLYDANGIEITDANAKARVTLTSEGDDSYFDGSNITFFTEGKTAVVKGVFHTYKYDNAGNETRLETSGTIVAVTKASTTISNVIALHIGENAPTDWTKASNKMTLDDVLQLYVKAVKTDGNEVVNVPNPKNGTKDPFTFESADSAALIVSESGMLYPIKQGNATVIVKYNDTVIGAVNVTVIAEATAASLEVTIDKQLLSLSKNAEDKVTLTVAAKDQLGRKLALGTDVDYKIKLLGDSNLAPSSLALDKNGQCTFRADDFTSTDEKKADGTYQYQVKVGSLVKVFSITVKTPEETAASSYKVELNAGATEIDLAIDLVNKTAKNTVDITLVESKGGIKYDIIDGVYTSKQDAIDALTEANAEVYYFDITTTTGSTVDGSTINLMAVSGSAVTKAATGMIKVTAFKLSTDGEKKIGTPQPLNTAYMAVKDTQAVPTVTVETQKTESVNNLEACFEVKVNDKKVEKETWEIGEVIGLEANTNRPFVKNIKYKAEVVIDGVSYQYVITIPVNQSILITK